MPQAKKKAVLQPLKRARRAAEPGEAEAAVPTGVPVPVPDERKAPAAWDGGSDGVFAAAALAASKRAAPRLLPDSPGPSSQVTADASDVSDASDDENIAPASPGQLDVAGRDYLAARRKAGGGIGGGRAGAAAAAAARAAWADLLRAEPAAVADAAAALEVGPPPRADEKAARAAELEAQFPVWREWQRSGASVFLYGFGSKRALLDAYAAWVPTGGVLVVDGGAPGASARAAVLAAARALGVGGGCGGGRGPSAEPAGAAPAPFAAGAGFGPGARRSMAAALASVRACPPSPALTVAVHGLDRLAAGGGGGAAASADAAALAALAACPAVRLVATVDHVNAPLLWDAAAAAAFAWRWVDATTLAPYSARAELGRLPPLDPAGGGSAAAPSSSSAAAAAAGALSVLASLVPHARAVFGLLATACLAPPPPGQPAPGIAFDDLFRAARARFLASSEAALRGHVGEFRDHGLVVSGGRWGAGGELLAVPLGRDALEAVLAGLEGEGVWGG